MRIGVLAAVIFHITVWLAMTSAWAQPAALAPPSERWSPPRLLIATPAEQPVRIESVKVRAEVNGSLAQTEIEMVFRNPNARILEGELQFPLLDGQSVSGFALDVNGQLREAVPIEKARGQAVFEEIIRGRIDPGLLQVTQGNNFKLRVYPLPANGTRQVVLRFTEALAERGQRLVYRLPLQYAERLDHFLLDLRIGGAASAPVIRPSELGPLALLAQGSFYTARVTRDQFAGRGVLEIEIPRVSTAEVYTEQRDGRTWFYTEVPVSEREIARKPARSVAIVWDSSGSGAARDHTRELALLDAYFRRMRNGEARLVRVRDRAEPAQVFRIIEGDWRALRSALAATPYDGATQLGAYRPEAGVDEHLLFSDGLANFGTQVFPQLREPLYAISSAARADATWLRHIAQRSGARHIDLTAEDTAGALRKLTTATTRVTAVTSNGAGDLVLASPTPERGRVRIAGELKQATATLSIALLHPGARESSVQVAIRAQELPGRIAMRQWAQLRVAELEANYDMHRAEIRRLGKAYGLVTRETSLIVLERIEDYARYEIVPPPELVADYERLHQSMRARRDADHTRHLAEVIRRFEDKATWWLRDFPKDERIAAVGRARPRADDRPSGDLLLREADAERDAQRPSRAVPAAPLASRPAPAQNTREERSSKSAAEPSTGPASSTIRLAPWAPNAPYLARLRKARTADVYRIYLDERSSHPASTAFFLDVADVLYARGEPALALRVLSNLAEMDLENRHILRILGYRLLQAGEARLALGVFRKVLELSPEEPQSYRDLGLAYAADQQHQRAIDTLYEVVIRPWHNRFPEVELITLADLNAIVATAPATLDTRRIHPALLHNLPLDMRVVLTWDADNTDIDLWVTDPNGERAYYGNRLTYQGGRMSQDFTGGYGPEEFSLKHAKPGRYRIEAQYFGDRRQVLTGPTTLQVKLGTKFGMPGAEEQLITLRLSGRSQTVFVGEFEVTPVELK